VAAPGELPHPIWTRPAEGGPAYCAVLGALAGHVWVTPEALHAALRQLEERAYFAEAAAGAEQEAAAARGAAGGEQEIDFGHFGAEDGGEEDEDR
jgi:hypothetical protein